MPMAQDSSTGGICCGMIPIWTPKFCVRIAFEVGPTDAGVRLNRGEIMRRLVTIALTASISIFGAVAGHAQTRDAPLSGDQERALKPTDAFKECDKRSEERRVGKE